MSLDSTNNLNYNSSKCFNLYVNCNNNPVMYVDPEGCIAVSTILWAVAGVVALLVTIHDLNNVKKLKVTVDEGNVKIENSYLILTPWIRYIFSLYLRYKNPETSNFFKGSAIGIEFEWMLHNIAHASRLFDEVQTKNVDLGYTIFEDKHGLYSLLMQVAYLNFNPINAITDFIISFILDKVKS